MAATPPIVKRYLIAFRQYNWLGFLLFLLSVGIAGVVVIQPPPPPPRPTYKALGQLAYRTPPPTFTSTGSQLQQQGRAVNRDILLSPWVLQRVAEKLKFNAEQILEIRDKRLKILFPGQESADQEKEQEQTQQPQVITLEYIDPESPTRATLILDAFMDEMVEYSRLLNTSSLRLRIEALSIRLGQVQGDLTQAEERFYRYITREGSDLLAVQDGSLFSGITSSQQRQRDIQLSLQQIEGQMNSLSKQLGLTPDQAYTSSALSADPIIANLRARILQNELQLVRLEQDLRPEHPNIIKLQKDQEVNEILLQQRAQELIGQDGILSPLPTQIRQESNLDPARQQLANQLVALQTQRDGLIKQLASVANTEQELRQQYEKFPDKQLQQARLVQAVEFQRVIYQNILTALVDAQSAEAETDSSLAVSQEPVVPPAKPYAPPVINRLLIIGAGAGIGLVVGAGVIFLLAMVDDRLHTPQELRDTLTEKEIPVLGQLPIIVTGETAERRPILVDAESPYLPYYERFRSNIRRLASDSCKVIVVTSISNEEGKTVTAYNLAIASAQAGKRTLLVEADLRSRSKARVLEVTLDPDATIEPLRYYANRSDAINLVPAIENLYVLPSPGPQRQAAAIIESSELQLLLKDARGRFDMVIVDTPSLLRCNDALLLESLTDGLILVTRPGMTRSSLLNEAIDQFAEADVSVLGAVINCVEGLTPASAIQAETQDSEVPPSEGGSSSQEGSRVEV
jgi:capsular exopolysaccharide synthesis family protein